MSPSDVTAVPNHTVGNHTVGNHTVSNHVGSPAQKELRYRPINDANKEPLRRAPSYQTPSSLPQR